MKLVEERNLWKEQFEKGSAENALPKFLFDYKQHRNLESFRLSKQSEILCEYVLWLEEKLKV
jgi:hypothetical protein